MESVSMVHVVVTPAGRVMLVIFANAPTRAAGKVRASVVSVLAILGTWAKIVQHSHVLMHALEMGSVTLFHTLASASVPLREKTVRKSSVQMTAVAMASATVHPESVFVPEVGVVPIALVTLAPWIASITECVTNRLGCANVTIGGSGKVATRAFV